MHRSMTSKAIGLAMFALPMLGVGSASPAAITPRDSQTAAWTYQVKKGDTLSGVARQFLAPGIGWQRVQRLNQVGDPRRLAPGSRLKLPMAWLRAEATVATVTFLAGQAQRQSGAPDSAVPVAVGDTLRPGDLLITADGASVTLQLVDTSHVLVSGGSRVRMESLLVLGRSGVTRTRLGLEQGEVDSRINPKRDAGTRYDVRTPALTLGVRGTQFRVRVDAAPSPGLAPSTTRTTTPNKLATRANRRKAARGAPAPASTTLLTTTAEVTEGRVAAAARGAERSVTAGYGIVATPNGRVTVPHPLPAAPRLDTLPVAYDRLPLGFSWPAAGDAVSYRAQVLAEGNPDARLLDGVFDRPAARWADLPDGRYVLQVRARNAEGLEGRDGRLAFTLKARPEPPFTQAPEDGGRAYGDTVELRWTRSDAAQRYRVQIASESRFDPPLVDRNDLTDTQVRVPLPPGRYYWRLASIAAGDDLGPFSDTVSFELRETPPPPAVESPKTEGRAMRFRWRERSGDDAYDVQVAHDPAFTQLLVERREDLPELVLDTPATGTYHLRVRTRDADGFVGPWGSAQQFEVPHSRWWWLAPLPLLLLAL